MFPDSRTKVTSGVSPTAEGVPQTGYSLNKLKETLWCFQNRDSKLGFGV